MGRRCSVLIPLSRWNHGQGDLLEVGFERRLRLLPTRAYASVATLERARVPFAAEAGAAAARHLAGKPHLRLCDVAAIIANPGLNMAGQGAWLGLSLGMVVALAGPDIGHFVATGDLVGDAAGESRIAPADRPRLALRLAVVARGLEHDREPVAVVMPATVDSGQDVRRACARELERIEELGATVLPSASLAHAVDQLRGWSPNPSRSQWT